MQYETLSPLEAIDICRPLLQQNFDETGFPGHEFRLHEATYQLLDEARMEFAIVAYDNDMNVAGFVFMLLFTHQHTSELCAQNDTIWIKPEYRKTFLGGNLIVRAEREARRKGAKSILWGVPEGSPIDTALASRHCYLPFQRTYIKEL